MDDSSSLYGVVFLEHSSQLCHATLQQSIMQQAQAL